MVLTRMGGTWNKHTSHHDARCCGRYARDSTQSGWKLRLESKHLGYCRQRGKFFVRSVNDNESTLPLKIKPGAPTNALVVDAQGQVGAGTDTPESGLHVKTGNHGLRIENTGDVEERSLVHLSNRGPSSIDFLDRTAGTGWTILAGVVRTIVIL